MAGELFKLSVGVDLLHVPFNGAPPAIMSTIAGHTPILFAALPTVASNIKDGQLRALAVTGASRSAAFPDVPTMAEAGFPNQESIFPQGILAPAGTPKDIVDLWYREVVRIVALPDVKARLAEISLNPHRCGSTIAIDGKETWLIHNFLYNGEADFESIDRDWAIRTILGVESNFRYAVISQEDWVGRRLVADRFRDRRVFICGDAAHLWIPHAGYGMNAGIADAANLAWMIAATLSGWAPSTLLDAYETERQPITEQASYFTAEIAEKIVKQRREIPVEIEAPGSVGEGIRARIGKEAYDLDVSQQCCGGLNFGYFYARSPIIAYDGETHPSYSMHDFTSSTVPGCRAPHLWLDNHRSLYDTLGPDYTLIRLDPTAQASEVVQAAAQRGVPLAILDIDTPEARALYARKLTLVRPDQHVAWRGDEQPADSLGLIDLVRGAGVMRASIAALQ
jgi:hypothetical protein